MSSLKEAARFRTNRPLQLDLAEDNSLANALRRREETFNADVLPSNAELMAPTDFYATLAFGQSRGLKQTTEGQMARPFPYLAAREKRHQATRTVEGAAPREHPHAGFSEASALSSSARTRAASPDFTIAGSR
jgi:hypothetical protein